MISSEAIKQVQKHRDNKKENKLRCATKAGLVSETFPSFVSSSCWSLQTVAS